LGPCVRKVYMRLGRRTLKPAGIAEWSPMTNPNDLDAALALSRFGLGAREGSIASIAQNPRGALKDEVTGRVLLTPAGSGAKADFRSSGRPLRVSEGPKYSAQPPSRIGHRSGRRAAAGHGPRQHATKSLSAQSSSASLPGGGRCPLQWHHSRAGHRHWRKVGHVLGQPLRHCRRKGPGGTHSRRRF
jgi:hypothetical protein